MRLRITMACGAALAANAFMACGTASSGLAPVLDGGGSEDSTAPSNDGGDASTSPDGSAPDAGEAGPADALSPTEAGTGEASLESDAGATGGDASTEGGGLDAGLGNGSDAAVCNPVDNSGAPSIGVVVNAGTPPGSMGGQVMRGTYFLTGLTSYGGNALCAAASAQGTAVVTADSTTSGTLDGVIAFTFFGNQQMTTTQDTYTTSGTAISLTAACPPDDAGATQLQFTATATQVIVNQASPVAACGTLVEVYTKQ